MLKDTVAVLNVNDSTGKDISIITGEGKTNIPTSGHKCIFWLYDKQEMEICLPVRYLNSLCVSGITLNAAKMDNVLQPDTKSTTTSLCFHQVSTFWRSELGKLMVHKN